MNKAGYGFSNGIFSALFIAGIILIASGCGGGEKPPTDGKVTITISHFWADVQDTWKDAIAEFERTHPKIHVEQQVVSFNVHYQKVLASAAAGEDVGDLVLLEDWFAQELLHRDYFTDLQPYVTRDLDSNAIFSLSLNTYRDQNGLRAFPVALGSYPLFYNKDLFDAAHIKYPDSTWTYDTLLEVAQKLTKDTDGDGKPDQYGLLLDNSGGFDGALYSQGGAVLTPDGSRSAFADPATIRALHYWVDLVQKYHVAPVNSSLMGGTSSGGSTRPFETGRFGMAMLQSAITTYKNVPFKWDIAMPPSGSAGRKYLRYGAAFGIPKNSKNKDAAWEFLRWMVKEMPAKYANSMFYGQVPNSRRLALSNEYLEGEPKVDRRVVIDMIDRHSFSYWRTKWREFRDEGFLPELDQMVSGQKTVEQGAVDADKRINEVLSK